jgi:exodeoxyribonuclease VII small subunit
MMSSASLHPETKEKSSIESSLGRLEEIVGEIEKTPPPLETLIERYEEGMQLLKICRAKLDAAEKRIEIITRSGRGETVLETFPES